MVNLRQMKIDRIADYLPHLDVEGDQDADTLLVGWGSTYGHIDAAMELLQSQGRKVAMAPGSSISGLCLQILRR